MPAVLGAVHFYGKGGAGGIEGGGGDMQKKLALKGGPAKKNIVCKGGHSKKFP